MQRQQRLCACRRSLEQGWGVGVGVGVGGLGLVFKGLAFEVWRLAFGGLEVGAWGRTIAVAGGVCVRNAAGHAVHARSVTLCY